MVTREKNYKIILILKRKYNKDIKVIVTDIKRETLKLFLVQYGHSDSQLNTV